MIVGSDSLTSCLGREGSEPEINDTETYDNGKMIVPSYLCEPQSLDKDNYEELVIDSGYYKEEEIMNAK